MSFQVSDSIKYKTMRRCFIFLSILSALASYGQVVETIPTEISAENVFELSIIAVYPDSFPNVSVVFQAKNEFGKPLWQLTKSEIRVRENYRDCPVHGLKNISEDKAVNIGLVFDHSGSMVDNPAQMPDSIPSYQDQYFSGAAMPDAFTMALDYAKEGVYGFLDEIKESKDSILFVGFSSEVDQVYPLSTEIAKIKSFVSRVSPAGSTSFYDALYESIDKLSNCKNKSVIVALTDGLDNASEHTYNEVIEIANFKGISIYTIGLGRADKWRLEHIAKETDGFYYYTNEAEKLKEIYLNIKEQIKSVYQVDYSSINDDFRDEDRLIRFAFANDTLTFSDHSSIYSLPEESIRYLRAQEALRIKNRRKNLTIGGLGLLLFGIAGFAIYKRRKRKSVLHLSAYPNPFREELTFSYSIPKEFTNVQLIVHNSSGKMVFSKKIEEGIKNENVVLRDLISGIYYAHLKGSTVVSKTTKIIKQ
ncbi:MAG: VWA domain-containing protein [Bacteroidota bacterium]